MNTYINTIVGLIEKQINSHQTSLIRLEGIESPIIYEGVCKELRIYYGDKVNIIAKLSEEKFNSFRNRQCDEWNGSIEYLQRHDLVDVDNAMTRWRNSVVDIEDNKRALVLLMGTEAVQDKGGLGDFYLISPDTIIEQLDGDYSQWFERISDAFIKDKDARNAINTLFKVIYSKRNVDIERLSSLIDELEGMSCITPQDVIEEICAKLDEYFGIPAIRDRGKVPKIAQLRKKTMSSAGIITRAYEFINREIFKKNYIKEDQLQKYQEMLIKYRDDNDINKEIPFPYDSPTFNNYDEFSNCVLEFIKGEAIDSNRKKLLKVDFSIITDILKIKIDKTDKTTSNKEKESKLKGDPISVYSHMILESIRRFEERYNDLPDQVEIEVESVKLSGCIKDEINLEKQYVCAALGGIINYISRQNIYNHEEQEIKIIYKDNVDVFNPANIEQDSVDWSITTKINDLCKVRFNVRSTKEDNKQKSIFLWIFEPQNEWKQAFKGMIVEKINLEDNILFPFMQNKNIGELFRCESDEAFYSRLDKSKIKFNKEIIDYIYTHFGDNNIIVEYYNKLVQGFNNVINGLVENGLFNVIQQGEMTCFITDYINYMEYLKDHIKEFTTNQRETITYLLNIFCITHSNKSQDERIIMPAYHPIMIDKLVSKLAYLRGVYGEIFDVIKINSNIKSDDIVQRIQRGNQLSTIECGADIVLNNGQLMCCIKTHGLFALYENCNNRRLEMSSNEVEAKSNEDEGEYQEFQIRPYTKIIQNHILGYIRTFPARCDGLNIVFINPVDTDHILKAIAEIRMELDKNCIAAKFNLRICLPYTRSGAVDYLREWSELMEQEESDVEIRMYVSYLEPNNYQNALGEKLTRYEEEQFDISFVYSILTPGKPEFKLCTSKRGENEVELYKFPTNTMTEPISLSQRKRYINISQHQFDTVKAYTLLAHSINQPNAIEGEYRVQRVLDMTQEQPKFLNDLHKQCRWVICIDEAIDKDSIQNEAGKVIGFTSGEGNSGELNITLSTREDVLDDICNRLYLRILKKFKGWSNDTIQKINSAIFHIAKELDGSRILQALNPNDYSIYNFLAYVLVAQKYKLLEDDDRYLVRVLINLDTHLHWFSTSDRNENLDVTKRPDLLLLEIENTPINLEPNEKLEIKATIIECKMGKENGDTVQEAQQQVEAGMKVLAKHWNTLVNGTNKKYWYGQLYRTLVFNPIRREDNSAEFKIISEKMCKIHDGDFTVKWHGEIYGFWLDSREENLLSEVRETDIHDVVSTAEDIIYYHAGQPYIKNQLNPYNVEENTCEIDDMLFEEDNDEDFERSVVNVEVYEEFETREIESLEAEPTEKIVVTKDIKIAEEIQEEIQEEIVDKTDNALTNEDLSVENKEVLDEVSVTNEINQANIGKDVRDIRVLLGEDIRTKEKIYWEFGHKQLNNRHLLISGNSGTGKTYCIQTLMYEMTKQGVSCVVFDYTDGFTTSKLDPILVSSLKDNIEQRYVVIDKFPLNPFKRLEIQIGDRHMPETTPAVATRMAAVFTSVYKFGMQQNGAIYNAVKEGLEKYGDNMNFNLLADELKNASGSTVASILSKIQAFLDIDPFDTTESFTWQDIMDKKGQIYVVQLTGFPRDIQLLLTEFILWDIWNFCVKYGDESKPLPIIIDEAQNLSHGCDSPTGKILTEGRKFGISGWFATQFLKGALKDDEIQRLQQAGQKLYFAPPEKEVTDMAKNIDINNENAKEWAEKLKKLQKGVCVTSGQMVKNSILTKYDPKIIKVVSLEERASERNQS